jgi:hypothetical protein
MVEVAMMHQVDPLSLVEFSLYLEQVLVHRLAGTQLIDKPQVSFVLDAVSQHADLFTF